MYRVLRIKQTKAKNIFFKSDRISPSKHYQTYELLDCLGGLRDVHLLRGLHRVNHRAPPRHLHFHLLQVGIRETTRTPRVGVPNPNPNPTLEKKSILIRP